MLPNRRGGEKQIAEKEIISVGILRSRGPTRRCAALRASLGGRFQVVPALNTATTSSSMVADCLPLHEMQCEQPGSRDHGHPCADDELIDKDKPVRAKPYQAGHHHPEDEHHQPQLRYESNQLRGVRRLPFPSNLPPRFHMFLILGHHPYLNESFTRRGAMFVTIRSTDKSFDAIILAWLRPNCLKSP